MRVLFDQGVLAPLRDLLPGHEVSTAYECGWSTLKNGELLAALDAQGFQVFVTTDTNLKYQQNLASRLVAIVVLSTTSWPRIRESAEAIAVAVSAAGPSEYVEVSVR